MDSLEELKSKCAEFNAYGRLEFSEKELDIDELKAFLSLYAKQLDRVRRVWINLSNSVEFPNEIFLLENLEEIYLSGKKIEKVNNLSLPEKITSFTLMCDSIDEFPRFLYTQACKSVLIKCRSIKSMGEGTIYLSQSDGRFTLDIDDISTLPPIELSSNLRLFKVKSKALRHIDLNFCQNHIVELLTMDCENLETIASMDATKEVRQFEIYTNQELDLTQWSVSDAIETLRIKAKRLKLPSLSQGEKLRTLHIEGVEGEINQGMSNCTNLTELAIRNSTISSISANIEKCQRLRSISIINSIDFFPECISKLSELYSLTINNNEIPKIDIDWSGLKNLNSLNLTNNNTLFSSLAFVSDLPNLAMLNIDGNSLESRHVLLHKKKIPMDRSYSVFSGAKVSIEFLLGFCSALAKTRLGEKDKHRLLDFVWEQGLRTDLLAQEPELLTLALNVQFKPVKTKLMEYVQTFVKNHNGLETLNKDSVLYIEGKPNTTLTKFKEKVSAIGYGFSRNLDKNVTHVIIGKSPSNPKAFDSNKFVYLTENDIFNLESQQNPKFLEQQVEQGSTSALDSVNDLLFNPELVNVKIGLQMLETGGVPEGLLEAVLMLAKSNPDAKVRAQAKKLLVEQGPSEWALLIDDKQLFKNLNESVKEQDINNKLKKIDKIAGFDSAATLSLVLYRRYKKGLRFLIERRGLSDQWLQKMYELLMEGEHFEFAIGLGYKNWKNTNPEDVVQYPFRANYPFPSDVLRWHKVTSINLHNTKLSSLPKGLALFKDLKKIDLSANYLTSIGPHIVELQEVEELDLTFNNFKKFPSNLGKLPKLKKVDLRYCGPDYDFEALEIPETVKKLLPDCEILV